LESPKDEAFASHSMIAMRLDKKNLLPSNNHFEIIQREETMQESDIGDLDLGLKIESDILARPDRYAEAIAWWNEGYSRCIYRKTLANRLRESRRKGELPRRKRHQRWHAENRTEWFALSRLRDAMHMFPIDENKWRRLGIRDAARILLVTALISRPDFDGMKIGLDEKARWSYGNLLNGDECFGRDWADGGCFDDWNDESGDNSRWWKLARAAWKVMQAVQQGTVCVGKGITRKNHLPCSRVYRGKSP